MTLELQSELKTILERDHEYFEPILNSEEFYFKKGKEALSAFLDYQVTDEQKAYLIKNKKDYQTLKLDFENNEEYKDLGRLIFTLVSYCDTNAPKKRELNLYSNKRVLAKAGLYMNYWVSTLIDYKFSNDYQNGVVTNALDYLINPKDNFTMLSNDHRRQLTENLFNKNYNIDRFKETFLEYFSPLKITPVNPDNYTHIISSLSYAISPKWLDTIIGLVTPDSSGWQTNAIEEIADKDYIILWNHKKPNGGNHSLGLLKNCLNANGYFRIFYTSQYQVHYIAEVVDFVCNQEELDEANWADQNDKIAWYHRNFQDYKDEGEKGKKASWIYLARKIYKVNPEDYTDFKYYKQYGYPSVGSQAPIVSITEGQKTIATNKSINNMISLLKYKKQIILQGPPGTGKTRMAKLLAQKMLGCNNLDDLEDNEQFEIIQFHPSYTYEDFVRGIAAKPNPDSNDHGVVYEAENRTLGLFAQKALQSHLKATTAGGRTENKFKNFVNHVIEEISERGKYMISDKVYIDFVDERRFKYKGDNWTAHPEGLNMNFSEINKIMELNLTSRQQINKNEKLNALTRQHATYFQNVIEKINELSLNDIDADKTEKKERNYVLVIDEINRANLSAVFGELIYALEYRGEKVKSMYEVNDDNGILRLPPNLYIIGTMNTADRSVGYIDYAIRRRFAFVEVLPENLSDELKEDFNLNIFTIVSQLFIKDYNPANKKLDSLTRSDNLTNDFAPKDVWLGHSYFIKQYEIGLDGKENKQKPIDFNLRIKYEIVPILKEYIKDGILKDNALEVINQLEQLSNA